MWYIEEFRQYLENIGHRHVWERRILPDMQKAIVNSMLCSQDAVDARKNCFELYGADFMISGDDLRPWLIEINASPCMAPSTSVTSDLTARVLEDTLKVVIDRRMRRNCDVGGFILLYKQKPTIPGNLPREGVNRSASSDSCSAKKQPQRSNSKGGMVTLPSIVRPASVELKRVSTAHEEPCSLPANNRVEPRPTISRVRTLEDRGKRPVMPNHSVHNLNVSGHGAYLRETRLASQVRRPAPRRSMPPSTSYSAGTGGTRGMGNGAATGLTAVKTRTSEREGSGRGNLPKMSRNQGYPRVHSPRARRSASVRR